MGRKCSVITCLSTSWSWLVRCSGAVSSSTSSTGDYGYLTHHSIIRNGLEVEGENNVVAMEFHFDDTTSSHTLRIGTFLAPYTADFGSSRMCVILSYYAGCYRSYETFTVTSDSDKGASDYNGPQKVFDFDVTSSWYEAEAEHYVQIQWSNWIPQINAFSINTYYSRTQHPSSFILYGGKKGASEASERLLNKEDVEYTSNDENQFNLVTNEKNYQLLRMEVKETQTGNLRFNEMALLTCRYAVPERMELNHDEVRATARVSSVKVGPVYDGFNTCTVRPTLPAGLSLDSASCTITGIPTATVDSTFTITASKPFNTEASFKLTITECDQTIIEVERTYGSTGYAYETHTLYNVKTGLAVETVWQNSYQKASTTIKNRYCVESGLYELSLDQISTNQWDVNSYIKINTVYDDETVTIVKWKYDLASGYSPSITLYLGDTIPRGSEWSYKMGELPSNWMQSTVPEDWKKGKKGEFEESTNHIQLYKKSFTLDDDIAGSMFEMGIRYKHGCVVVVNGYELFRNHIDIENENLTDPASESYDELKYRRVSFPVALPSAESDEVHQILKKGTNVITILLLAASESQKTSDFDASLHLTGRESVGRIFDFTATATDAAGVENLFDMSSNTFYTSTSCSKDRYVEISFNDDRREWISKYVIVSSTQNNKNATSAWKFQAKNPEDADWTDLDNVTDSLWWSRGQQKEVWVYNTKPFNKYRFSQLTAPGSLCTIDLMEIALYADSITHEMPELSYNGNSTGYLNVDFTDLNPNSHYYKQFSVTPKLPSFLTLDSVTGIIRGTDVTLYPMTQHTITALRLNGTVSSTVLFLQIIECDKAMIELAIRSDSFPKEQTWYLYKGASASGDPVYLKEDGLEYSNQYHYKYFCLDKDIYTFKFQDADTDGWRMPAGYRIMTSQGYSLGYGTVPSGSERPVSRTHTFSTNVVATQSQTEWKTFAGKAASRNWYSVGYDDSDWQAKRAGDDIAYDGKTRYFRYKFNIPNLTTYPVLNVAVNYGAGIVAYLNGARVYRSNMPTEVTYDTDATQERSTWGLMEFSIPLQLKGANVGDNVLAFELHRTSKQATTDLCKFNVNAILGTGDCTPLRNDVMAYYSTTPTSGYTYALFDNSISNYIAWDWVQGTYFNFTYENLDGLLFNQYRIYADGNHGEIDFTIYAKRSVDQVWYTFDQVKSASFPDRSRYERDVPNGLIGFNQFMFVIDSVQMPSGFTIDELEFAYCPFETTKFCPGVGEYPSTGDGQISVSVCPENYDGYSYRVCEGDRLGDVQLDKCKKFAPTNLAYPEPEYRIYVNAQASGVTPSVYGLVDGFDIQPHLPEGLSIDQKTGEIVGTPKEEKPSETYTVTAYNDMGSATASFKLRIVIGWCEPDEKFDRTPIGETATYDCAVEGSSGTLRRTCRMGKNEPEWGMTIGVCMNQNTYITLIIVAVAVVIIVVIIVVKFRSDKKKVRARSAVRGGKKNINIMKSVPYTKI